MIGCPISHATLGKTAHYAYHVNNTEKTAPARIDYSIAAHLFPDQPKVTLPDRLTSPRTNTAYH